MKLTPNQRIALNAMATYVRTFVRIGMALFTSRWVLSALGQSDFGLYGVVGSIIGFIGYLNLVMSGSVGRFYAFAIGQASIAKDGSKDLEVCAWFNVAFFVHLCIATFSAGVGYFVGIYAIEHWLTIPSERMIACLWVFRISIVGMFVSIMSVPFTALFGAYQYITELVFFEMLTTVIIFFGSYGLLYSSGDRLIWYALLMTLTTSGIVVVQCLRARILFKDCRIRICFWTEWIRIRQLLSFAGWKMLGIGAWLLRAQGVAVVINLFHGPRYNASYSVATQLSAQSSTLSNALSNALNPAVTTIAGTGNRVKFIDYSLNACKFSAILTSLAAIPIICECGNVLRLWLGSPPDGAATLCTWFAVAYLVQSLSAGFSVALNANGRIAGWQVAEALVIAWPLPATWICYNLGFPVSAFGYLFAISYSIMVVERVFFARRLLDLSPRLWARRVLVPVALVMVSAFVIGMVISRSLPATLFRLCMTTAATLVVQCGLAWCICLTGEERVRISGSIACIVKKATGILEQRES